MTSILPSIRAALFLTALASMAGWGGFVHASSKYDVVIESMKYSPESLQLKLGDRVTWHNKDFFPHTVTSQNEKNDLNSRNIPAGGSWSYVVKHEGHESYICKLHPTMHGSLDVR